MERSSNDNSGAAFVKIEGEVSVTCAACGVTQRHPLVQSVDLREDPAARQRLLAGELNVARCTCGKRTQLAANLVVRDPDLRLLCHVCPDGEAAMQRAEAAFAESFAGAPRAEELHRVVPSLNALVEKVKIADAGLHDWAIEMTKVVLLASIAVDDDDRVMLFAGLDRERGVLRWLLFDARAETPAELSSPLEGYHRLIASAGGPPPPDQRRIDRAWAIDAVRQMMNRGN